MKCFVYIKIFIKIGHGNCLQEPFKLGRNVEKRHFFLIYEFNLSSHLPVENIAQTVINI